MHLKANAERAQRHEFDERAVFLFNEYQKFETVYKFAVAFHLGFDEAVSILARGRVLDTQGW